MKSRQSKGPKQQEGFEDHQLPEQRGEEADGHMEEEEEEFRPQVRGDIVHGSEVGGGGERNERLQSLR
eukprot:CAMPEP_0182505208 /NCGR_PEP_ID=MMETSP1321-20130603/18734_1 /TAXON_ID=91990 /ORGANISM="Bolidomonas sp., Strain RCC1657" /LENGTH=67 /DNA_ID=CAMNT_0024710709 /DNA_START=243 /DNA_END=444 /DNA_ORIENTATION=+